MTITRRDYLKKSLGLAALGAASSCSSLDSFFKLDQPTSESEVIIVGGGSAGLAAAHQLKKLKIPYRLFEASSRLGGRVYTTESTFREGAHVELGADLFELRHQVVFDLLKEYKLESDEVETLQSRDRHFGYRSKWIKQTQLNQLLESFYKDWNTLKLKIFSDQDTLAGQFTHPMVVSLDQWLLKDYLLSLRPQMDSELRNLLLSWISIETGTPAEKVSALQWILFWDQKNFPQAKYKVIGGNQRLLQSMYDRISGVIPNYLVRLNRPLVDIDFLNGLFVCTFESPEGLRRVKSKYVVLALPPNQLKKITGLNRLNIPQAKKEAINEFALGQQQRIVFETKDFNSLSFGPGEKDFISLGEKYFSKNKDLKLWSYKNSLKNKSYYLNYVDVNLSRQAQKSSFSPEALLLEISNSINKKYKSLWTGEALSLDWKNRKWIEGSRFQYEANQYYLYRGIFNEPDYNGGLHFVGDYTHPTEWSSWAGALESGINAALKISQVYKTEGASFSG